MRTAHVLELYELNLATTTSSFQKQHAQMLLRVHNQSLPPFSCTPRIDILTRRAVELVGDYIAAHGLLLQATSTHTDLLFGAMQDLTPKSRV